MFYSCVDVSASCNSSSLMSLFVHHIDLVSKFCCSLFVVRCLFVCLFDEHLRTQNNKLNEF